jgi:ribosomal RNA-processing protein 12
MDTVIAPSWVLVLGNALIALNLVDRDGSGKEIHRVWKAVWAFLESSDRATRKAAVESLDLISKCFTSELIEASIIADTINEKSTLGRIISQTSKALESISLAQSVPEVLDVISSLLESLLANSSAPAVQKQLLPLITQVADLRVQKGFEHKELADATLSVAMRMLGPEVILSVLPLNLAPGDREAGREPRAFLLPLLSQPHPSPMKHFVSYFVPLSEQMFDLQQKAETEGRQSEAKVWTVLISQVWMGFPGYCFGTPDLPEVLSPSYQAMSTATLTFLF